MEIQLEENGRPNLQSVNEFAEADPDAFSRWIRNRLHDADTRVPDDPKQDIGQYYLIGALYSGLESSTQAEIRRALRRFLRKMQEEGDSWNEPAVHSLLLLIQNIEEKEVAEPVARMARQEHFLDSRPNKGLHARLLQTLNFLGKKMSLEFWKHQVDIDASRFGVYAFAGMRMHSLDQALGDILPVLPLEDETLRSTLGTEIRGLLMSEPYSHDELAEIVNDMKRHKHFSDEAFRLICEALPELNLDAEPVEDSRFDHAREYLGQKNELESEQLAYAGS